MNKETATIFSAITINIEKAVKIPTIVIKVKTSTKWIATGIIFKNYKNFIKFIYNDKQFQNKKTGN